MSKSSSPLVASLALAVWATAATAASAQSSEPMVPNPANPFPDNPVATDGASLRSVWPSRTAGRVDQGLTPSDLQALSPSARYRR